jgi:hypothetical protein
MLDEAVVNVHLILLVQELINPKSRPRTHRSGTKLLRLLFRLLLTTMILSPKVEAEASSNLKCTIYRKVNKRLGNTTLRPAIKSR